MTKNQFNSLCCEFCIHPEVALENENLVEALKNRNDEMVEQILREEF
jgi:hypothetical protein